MRRLLASGLEVLSQKFFKEFFRKEVSELLNTKNYLQLTGLIFAVVGLVHLVRVFMGSTFVIMGHYVPVVGSIVGAVVAGYLAYNAFMLSQKKR